MPGPALSDALTDFANPSFTSRGPGTRPRADAARRTEEPEQKQPNISDLVAVEIDRTRADLTNRLKAEHEAAIADERERHAKELAETMAQFGEQAATVISERLNEAEQRLVELTTSITARILGTILANDIRERGLQRLAETIKAALADEEAVRMRVRGSPSLCEALRAALKSHADQIDFSAGDGFDLTVTIDDSIYETRLSEWSFAMTEALE